MSIPSTIELINHNAGLRFGTQTIPLDQAVSFWISNLNPRQIHIKTKTGDYSTVFRLIFKECETRVLI